MNKFKPKSHFLILLKNAFFKKRYALYLLTPLVVLLPFVPFEKERFNKKNLPKTSQPTQFEEDAPYKIKKIVLDAGHGGNDTGCHTEYGTEKNNTLAITLRLGALLKENFPEIEIIYTRDKDEFIELHKRADIANKAKADLFISIHCNSTDEASGAYGTETYVLGNHRKDDNFEVARRENQSILLESDYKTTYDGFDPNSTEAYIIFSLYQNAYLDKSILFAKYVEENLQQHANRKSLGVKQAGFIVLRETAMPSVLVETGFLNHPRDGEYISSNAGQESIAESVFKSVEQFKHAVEETTTETYNDLAFENNPVVKSNRSILLPKESVRVNKPTEIKTPVSTLVAKPQTATTTINKVKEVPTVPTNILSAGLNYKVQLSVENGDVRQTPRFKNLGELNVVKEGSQFKILKPAGFDYCEAVKVVKSLRQKGFADAFIVAYKNGARVKVLADKCN